MNEPQRQGPAAAIAIVTPAPRGSRGGNRVTALRWARLLRQLGHRPFVTERWDGRPAAAMLAIHARKSAASVQAFASAGNARHTAVLLAGTEVYPQLADDVDTRASLRLAHRVIALQPEVLDLLPDELRARTRVLIQSARAVWAERPTGCLQACVLAHLRAIKDPLLPFRSAQSLPPELHLRVLLAGRAIEPELGAEARRLAGDERATTWPQCRWLGELPRRRALHLLAESHVCIVPSHGEGGANVLSEAIAAGTPPLCSDIPGNTGLLGRDWPGLFPPGSVDGLAALLRRVATEPGFLVDLRRRTERLLPLVLPEHEREGLRALLTELAIQPN